MRGSRAVSRFAALVSLAALAGVSVTACVVTTVAPPSRGIMVSGPPPAIVREERRPPPPAPQASWISGYWHWTGIQYAWIPGHWEAAPPMGTTWRAPLYVQNNGAYFYEPGGWAPNAPRTVVVTAPPTAEAFH